jgi:peptide/nickel transport system permease protein
VSLRYLAQRVVNSVVVVLGVMTILFTLLHISGDPVAAILPPFAPAAQREAVRAELGLDRPLYVQFVDFIARGLRGEFGKSWRHNQSAMALVVDRLPATAQLAAAALMFAVVFGTTTGVIAATRRDSSIDSVAQVGGLLGQCVPGFWLGIVLILVFAVQLRWFPPSGSGSWQHLVLPAITAGFYPAAMIMRLMRSNLLDILSQDYIRTARAKGLARPSVVISHALRNASIPVVTFIGLQVAFIMGGLVVVETVFGYPGMGLLTVQAISNRDFPVIQAFVMVMALIILAVNLLVDLTYVWLDPRIRYG